MVPAGKDETGRPISKLLKPKAYFKTYNEAYAALVEYNKDPYDPNNLITVDEFYNLFLKKNETNSFKVELTNVPSDIKAMLDAVSRTQVNAKVIPAQIPEVTFKDVNEFLKYICTVTL